MTMRIPWHLHHSFVEHCVALPALPKPEDIVIDKPKSTKAAKSGGFRGKQARAQEAAKRKWAANRKAKDTKY